jgi:hypothetical protein
MIIGRLDVDADELWSFVKPEAHTPGIWLAI